MSDNQDSDSEVNFNLNNHPDRREENNVDQEDNGGVLELGNLVRNDRNMLRKRITNVKPDAYTGEEDWEQYISYFEDCAELGQWTEREKLLYLATALKQQARVHYSSLPQEEKQSFRSLAYSLEQRFGSKRQQSRWISKLQNRIRGRNETIRAFGDEIRLYSQKAYVALDQEAQEMLALQQLYKNVSPEMRCRLMDRDCRTIREAVEIVERYEEVIGRSDSNARMSHVREISGFELPSEKRDSRQVADRIDDMGFISGSLNKIEKRLEKLEARDQQRSNTREFNRKCYQCGSSEHFIRNCPNRNSNGSGGPRYQGNGKQSHQ